MARRVMTKELCYELSQGCFNRNEFRLKDEYAYKKAIKEGWIDLWFDKFKFPERCWTLESLKTVASLYETKNSFKWGNWNAYHAALRKPYFEEVCSHMRTISASDKDVLYLLKTLYEGVQLYKVGITSERCRGRRKAELKYSSKLSFEVLHWLPTKNAQGLEESLLKIGTRPDIPKFRGYTEMRIYTDEELNLVEDLIYQAGGV